MIDRGNNEKIAYCCDYKASCAGPGCRCNGGECSHTFDPEHARFGSTDRPEVSARFYRFKAPGLSPILWEFGSSEELHKFVDFDTAMMEGT